MSTFSAQVIAGRGRGRTHTVPTLNLALIEGEGPEGGVYVARVMLEEEGVWHAAVMHVGARPTFDDDQGAIELHLVRFQGDPQATTVRVEVLGRLREVRRFDSAEALKKQILTDIMEAERYWNTAS